MRDVLERKQPVRSTSKADTNPLFRRTGLLAAIALALLAGCESKTANKADKSAAEAGAPKAAKPKEVTVKIVTPDEFNAVLKEQQGKVVLLDVWATWCGPCRDAFPHTVELTKKFPEADLSVITLSQDVTTKLDEVLKFLKSQDAKSTLNLMCQFTQEQSDADKDILADYGLKADGIPYYVVYGRDGKPFRAFLGGEQDKDIEAAIREAIGKK